MADKNQRGATAIEFALVFPVFFLVFYGMLTYGLIFMMRLNLQHAAEEGARAALRYQRLVEEGSESPAPTQLELRRRYAITIAERQSDWLRSWKPGLVEISARICKADAIIDDASVCPANNAAVADCDVAPGCQVIVTVRYPYAAADNGPAIPPLPGIGLVTVATSLASSASEAARSGLASCITAGSSANRSSIRIVNARRSTSLRLARSNVRSIRPQWMP